MKAILIGLRHGTSSLARHSPTSQTKHAIKLFEHVVKVCETTLDKGHPH
jgi:hypothetical protein